MLIRFNVFGKKMSVDRKDQEWLLFNDSNSGLRARIYDVVIPADLEKSELEKYLDDIYHEYSSVRHPSVVRLS